MSKTDLNEIVISREFNAPRELVFKVFTEAEHMAHWWGPKGFAMEVARLDLRPGGLFLYCMRSPNGQAMWGRFVYHEIVAPERVVFVNSFSDEQGGITPNPWLPNYPLEVLNTLTLTEQDGKTTFTLKGGPINATEEQINVFNSIRPNMEQGFKGTFDQLDEYLAKIIS